MSFTADSSKTLQLRKEMFGFTRRHTGATLVTVMILVAQLIGINGARAGEAKQPDAYSVGQTLARVQQIAQTYQRTSQEELSVSEYLQNEIRCLALNIYFEARSEPESGQRAVGHVVLNRVAHRKYPDSVCSVVQQGGERVLHRCQFSWWCDGQSDSPRNQKAWVRSLRLAWKVYFGIMEDTTGGALWYHATYVKPYWSDSLLRGPKFGQHVFYLENRASSETL